MPLWPELMGKISASRAADFSVDVTESVARGMDYELPPGIFCTQLVPKLRAEFKSKYPDIGATVQK